MDELRINAALAELNAIIAGLTQRCIQLSGDLAVAKKQVEDFNRNTGNDDN